MIEVVITYTRPNTEVEFYLKSPEFLALINSRYGDKRLFAQKTLSKDTLTLTQKAIWTSIEDFTVYENDEVLKPYMDARHDYHVENNIACTRTINNLEY